MVILKYNKIRGDIMIFLGDCVEIMQQLVAQNVRVDAIIADLPYFQVVEDDWDNQWRSVEDYLTWIEYVVRTFNKLLKENASIMLFTGRQYNRQIACILDKYFTEQRIIIWARKRNINTTRGKALASGYEPICYYTKGNPVFNNLKIKPDTKRKEYTDGILKEGVSLSDVWSDIPALPHNSKEKVNHPTQKPIALMERCINICTNENDTVLDFCMGSGSTGVACKNLNRNFIGIEKDEKYFEIAEDRLNQVNMKKRLF